MYNSGLGPKVLSGEKRSTIRRSAKCMTGTVLSHRVWEGLPRRSKQQELCQTVCRAVTAVFMEHLQGGAFIIRLGKDQGEGLSPASAQARELVKKEGFSSWEEMTEWFIKQHVPKGSRWRGVMIEW